MYQSTDHLVSNEQGVSSGGYQAIEGGGGGTTSGNPTSVAETPQTFLSQVKRAKEESVGCCSFCLAFFGLLLGSLVWTLVVIVIVTVPIVMIVIGAEYFHDCPVEKMIPISLIVAGCVALLSNLLNFIDRFRRFSESGLPKRHTVIGWINVCINIFLAAWFIATCYWVYGSKVDLNADKSSANYCNPHLYGFIYWLLNFVFIFFGTMVVVSG
ncbi:hypothetical protein X975_19442, partial [Stegodyphus mimosarum]